MVEQTECNSDKMNFTRTVFHCRSSTLNRRRIQQRIAEESEDKEHSLRKPLVTTQFVEWSCKKFAQPMMNSKIEDVESTGHYEKEWRYLRLERERKENPHHP